MRIPPPPVLFLLAAAGAALAAHRLVRWRRRGESGRYWAFVTVVLALVASPLLVASGALETLAPTVYQSGRHLYLDLTGAFGWSFASCYLAAFAAPLGLWLGLLGLGFARRASAGYGWLAGGVGAEGSRAWLVLCAAPAVTLVAATWPRLGRGPGGFPAAAWGTMALFALSLLAAAASDAVEAAPSASGEKAVPRTERPPWPEAMRQGGIRLRRLGGLAAAPAPAPPTSAAGRRLAARLELAGARGVAPALVEGIASLLDAGEREGPRARLIRAPDGCGQVESVALVADLLARRDRAHTLVITAGDAAALAARLARWLPQGTAVAISPETEIPPPGPLWVADLEALSERVLPRFRDPGPVERLGLVVWWDLHELSGLAAASVWAVSRRLERLLAAHGRPGVRTLALLRRSGDPETEPTAFVQRLLPLPLDAGAVVEVAAGGPKAVELHLVEGRRTDPGAEDRRSTLVVSAARVSLDRDWSTTLDPSPAHDEEALALAPRLTAEPAEAEARLHRLEPSEVLALPELCAHGGRGVTEARAHYVGLVAPEHGPYALHALEHGAGERRRLWIAPQPRGELMRRQLLLALSELPDTRGGLLRDFLLDAELIETTLGEIAREGNLTRTAVRHLDRTRRLVTDHRYEARRVAEREQAPTARGRRAVELRDPTAVEAIRRRVDRERLTVEAYPHRVLFAGGHRYRVDEWTSIDDLAARGWVGCRREDAAFRTFRRRHATVFDVRVLGTAVTVGRSGASFTRVAADLGYEEEVTGVVQVATGRASTTPEVRLLDQPIRSGFETRALLLGFRRPEGPPELVERAPAALCEALRHVWPVHLAIEEDALELVPLLGEETAEGTYGLALVELYAGGIGLVEALQSRDAALVRLLRQARGWLETCRCQNGRGCCLDTPIARAAATDRLPEHRSALALLAQAV